MGIVIEKSEKYRFVDVKKPGFSDILCIPVANEVKIVENYLSGDASASDYIS